MKANSLFVVMIVAAMLLALTGSVRADTMFTENFNDGTVGANLVNQGGNQVISGQCTHRRPTITAQLHRHKGQ